MDPVFALEQRFLGAMRVDCGVADGTRMLVAVSAGPDSVALLRLLQRTVAAHRHPLVVAHLDHGLRPEGALDAAFVRALAAQLALPCLCERVSVPELARAAGCGWEEAARAARREFLLRTAAAQGCALIALGHQRGDQAETVLHRLLRGTGATGLAAMRPRDGALVRPLLGFARAELLAYLQRLGQTFREDASNADTRYTRNRIRHELLPLLTGFNPQIEGQLAGLARRLATEEDYWREQVEQAWQQLSPRREAGRLVLQRPGLLAQHPALRARVLRQALRLAGITGEVGQAHLAAFERLVVSSRPQGELYLPAGWVGRRYDEVWCAVAAPPPIPSAQVAVAAPGDYPLPGGGVLRVTLTTAAQGEHRGRVEFAAERVAFPFTLRRPRPGDRFRPSGMVGHRKLKDYFIAERLPREERCRQWLVAGAELLWLVGRRRCAGYEPTKGGSVLGLELLDAGN